MIRHGIIILAAGASSRMGKSKLELDVHGQPMLHHITNEAFKTSPSKLIIVSGGQPLPQGFQKEFDTAEVIINPTWAEGMGSSIRCGVKALTASSLECFIILVADQPKVNSVYLQRMLQSFARHSNIIASQYSDTVGVPVLFPGRHISLLQDIPVAQGAKHILSALNKEVTPLPFPEGAIDLDTPEDYDAFLHSKS